VGGQVGVCMHAGVCRCMLACVTHMFVLVTTRHNDKYVKKGFGLVLILYHLA